MPVDTVSRSETGEFDVFRLRNSTGGAVVSVDDHTARCVAREAGPGETVSNVVVFRPRGNTVFGFLMIGETASRPIRVLSDPLVAPVLSFVLDRTFVPGRVAIRSPTAPRFICGVPSTVAPDADLNCNRGGPGEWEGFLLEPIERPTIHPTALRLLKSIQTLMDAPLTARSFLAWVYDEQADIVRSCGQAVLRLLDRDDLKVVAVRCLDEDGFLDRLLPVGCDDKWLTQLFPAFRRWNIERTGPSQITLDQSWDHLGRDFGWERLTSLGEILHALAREAIEPRRGICVMTTARNEGIYFLEWIAHHRALGVEHFFVYSNDNNDGSDELLSRLAEAGLITWISNSISKGVDLQTRAYTHCLTYLEQPLDFRWTILIDLDEFIVLNPDRHASLTDFLRLQASRGAEAVSMNWSMYTPSGEARWDERPLIERFTYREPPENHMVKTAFITRLHTASWPHNPVGGYRRFPVYLNAAGRVHHGLGSTNNAHHGVPTFQDAWIAHYFFKSLDEYIWKTSRGFDLRRELSFKVEVLVGFLKWFDRSSSVEDRRALPHLDALKQELTRLRSHPGLSEAENIIRKNFVERVGTMKAEIARSVEAFADFDPGSKERLLLLLNERTVAV